MPRDFLAEFGLGAAPPTGTEESSLESLLGSPAPEEGLLSRIGDLIGRPYAAVGEGFGALRSGTEGPVGAMWRGFYEGEQLYEDLSKQLIPDDPDDDYDTKVQKQIGRFAIDVAGDPLMYVGAGAVKGAVGPILGPAARAADKVIRKIPVPQVLARFTMPMTHVFTKFGGRAGKAVSRRLTKAYDNHKLNAGRVEQDFIGLLGKLGIKGNSGTPYRRAAMDLLEGADATTPYHADPKTQELFQFLRTRLDDYAGRVEAYRDRDGLRFKIIEPMLLEAQEKVIKRARKMGAMGKKWRVWRAEVWDAFEKGTPLPTKAPRKARALLKTIQDEMTRVNYKPKVMAGQTVNVFMKGFHQQAWKRRANYAPYILNSKFAEQIFTKQRGYHKAVRQFAKQLNVSEEKALDILKNMALPKRAGNIEYARHLPFTEEMFEKDPLKWFPKYASKVEERIAYADQFGLNGQILDSYVRTMKGDRAATIDKKWLRDARDIITGKYQSDRSVSDLARKIMGIQVMTKMGFLSSLSNLSQNSNTIIREGAFNFLKGALRSMTKAGQREGYIAYQKGIQDELIKLAGGEMGLAHRYLDWTMFNPIERINRILAANAGVMRAQQLVKRELRSGGTGKMTSDLFRRGVTEQDMLDFQRFGKFSREASERIGFKASEATQHATHFKDIPIGWQDPFMRIMTQYKNFIFQQSRFLMKDVLGPAKEYLETGGRQGSVAPLMRAGVTFGIAAETTAFLRDQFKMAAAKGVNAVSDFLGADANWADYEPREREDQWFLQLLQDSLNVGALGIAGDLVDRASYREVSSWLLGPTFGDMTDLIEEGTATVGRMSRGQDQPVERWMRSGLRRVPFATGVLPSKTLQPGAEAVTGAGRDFLKELGL
jgi:hypothetical protein